MDSSSSSSQDDGSSSSPDDVAAAAVTNSNDESFDSASHDNSHDVASASSADCASITDTVCAMEGVTFFCDVLKEMMLIPVSTTSEDDNKSSSSSSAETADSSDDSSDMSNVTASKHNGPSGYRHIGYWMGLHEESKEFTLFVPTDAAFAKISTPFEQLSDEEAGRVIMFHFYKGMMLTSDTLKCGEKIISMNEKGDASRTKCMGDNKKYQNGNANNDGKRSFSLIQCLGFALVIGALVGFFSNLDRIIDGDDDSSGNSPSPALPASVVAVVTDNADLSTLASALTSAGLIETLSGAGPFTVFGPTNV